MVIIMSGFAMAVPHAHLLDQKFPVLGAGVPPQIQGLEKLVQAGYPAGLQRVRESLVGSQENGCVGFVGVQDQDVLGGQIGLRLILSFGQRRAEIKDQQGEQKQGAAQRHPSDLASERHS